ncbi:MAG: chemotaxis response regulator protein-glutamate methylesterase [Deltaproteobacteria bacterium]|nr:chemotaxis response regulator protein-glutamate methylesterase [Deltaproteobacteria bacterium]
MIKVMIIDDSAVVRTAMTDMLADAAGIEVVATAADPIFARDKLKKITPDVITLDVEMPRMDGLTFLKKLMAYKPIPVIMVSSLTQAGAKTTLEALNAGAVDYIGKPTGSMGYGLQDVATELIEKIRSAATARLHVKPEALQVPPKHDIEEMLPLTGPKSGLGGPPIVVIGASTGGTVALETVLSRLHPPVVPIVVVQHMPPLFTHAFAERLNSICHLQVTEAQHNQYMTPNTVTIAKGGFHLLLQISKGHYYVEVKDAPPVNRHKPSVDVLFRSTANSAGRSALGIIMTGMGDDGAKGLLDMKNLGATTVAQDEQSCVVFGMPGAALRMGAATREISLGGIDTLITTFSRKYGSFGALR